MKTCVKCGAPLSDNARFCGKCGAPQPGVSAPGGQRGPQPSSQGSSRPAGGSYPQDRNPARGYDDPYGRQPRQTSQDYDPFGRGRGDAPGRGNDFGQGYSDGGYSGNGFPGGRQRQQGNAFGRENPRDRGSNMDYGYGRAPKRGKGKLIALIVALMAVVAAAAVVIFVVKPFGEFWHKTKGGKVESAVRTTMDSVPIVSTLHTKDVVNKGKFTLSADITVAGQKINAAFSQNPSGKEQSLSLAATINGQPVSIKEYLDKNAVYIDPGAGTVFRYGYNETKNGALMTADPSASAAVGMIDTLLKLYVDNMNVGDVENSGVIKKVEDDLRALPVTNIDKKDFEIDGKTQSLTGRSIAITPADLKKIVNDVLSDPTMSSIMSAATAATGSGNPLSSLDLSELDELGNVKINVYDYKSRLGAAEIIFENPQADGMVATILFKGSEPFDNVVLSARSNSMPEQVLGSILTEKTSAGTKVTVNINPNNGGVTLYAKHENNILTIGNLESGGAEVPAITCGLIASKDSITISDISFNPDSYLLREMGLYDVARIGTIQGTIKLESNAKIEKVNTSGAFDLGNATMEQLQNISPDQLGILAQMF